MIFAYLYFHPCFNLTIFTYQNVQPCLYISYRVHFYRCCALLCPCSPWWVFMPWLSSLTSCWITNGRCSRSPTGRTMEEKSITGDNACAWISQIHICVFQHFEINQSIWKPIFEYLSIYLSIDLLANISSSESSINQPDSLNPSESISRNRCRK